MPSRSSGKVEQILDNTGGVADREIGDSDERGKAREAGDSKRKDKQKICDHDILLFGDRLFFVHKVTEEERENNDAENVILYKGLKGAT